MTYNLNEILKDYEGKDVLDVDNTTPLAWKTIVVKALNDTIDAQTTSEEKMKRFSLSIKIVDHPENIELSADEISLILNGVNKAYTALVVGRADQFFNQKN